MKYDKAAKRGCHSEENNNFLPKNLATANTEVYPSKSSLTREDLCFGIVAHDNNFNSPETDQASKHLGIFASKSVSTNLLFVTSS